MSREEYKNKFKSEQVRDDESDLFQKKDETELKSHRSLKDEPLSHQKKDPEE